MQRTITPNRIRLPESVEAAELSKQEAVFGKLVTTRAGVHANDQNTDGLHSYVLIEAVRKPDIAVLMEGFDVPFCCLYSGDAAEDYALEAPYLAQVQQGTAFADWLLNTAWGNGFAVFLRSRQSLAALRKHFRRFTRLYDADEQKWHHFRFYAPEVVRRSLPMMPPREFSEISQGIDAIITESADGRSIYVI